MQLWQSWLGAHMCDRTVGVDPKGSERGNSHGRHHPEKDPSRPANLETSVCEERDSAARRTHATFCTPMERNTNA